MAAESSSVIISIILLNFREEEETSREREQGGEKRKRENVTSHEEKNPKTPKTQTGLTERAQLPKTRKITPCFCFRGMKHTVPSVS